MSFMLQYDCWPKGVADIFTKIELKLMKVWVCFWMFEYMQPSYPYEGFMECV